MIRIEAFPYMDAAVVRVTGICNGGTHGGPNCEGHSMVTQIAVEELEGAGVSIAVMRAVRGALEADPVLASYLMH